MPSKRQMGIELYAQDRLRILKRYGITHMLYGFSERLENIVDFGIHARVGKEFSTLPEAFVQELTQEGYAIADGLALQHCWMRDEDFLWAESDKWYLMSTEKHRHIRQITANHGFAVGVSIPLRKTIAPGHTLGAAVLFYAQGASGEEFRALYDKHAKRLHNIARVFDQLVRAQYLPYFYALNAHEKNILRLYARLGDPALVARHLEVGVRAVQLSLQKIRKKLRVNSNLAGLNLCNTFDLLD